MDLLMPDPVSYGATIRSALRALLVSRPTTGPAPRLSVLRLPPTSTPRGPHVVMWAFRVREGAQEEFERLYGANGEWVRLFRRSRFYLGTELWRDRDQPNRYITVDRWRSRAECERFLREQRSDYEVLDALGRRLTIAEARLASLDRIGA